MQVLNKRIYLNELLNTTGMLVTNGVVGRIHVVNSCIFYIILKVKIFFLSK